MATVVSTAVVTGAGSRRGIGRKTAHTLAANGWAIAILDIDEAAAREAAAEIADRHAVQARGVSLRRDRPCRRG